jgi:hypothetical protein
MYVNKDNNQFIADKISRRQGMRCKKGGGYGLSESSVNYSIKNNLGKYPMHPEKYSSCGGVKNPSNLGASVQRGGKSTNYGFSSQGANMAHVMRGSYPVYTKSKQSQCGGRRKRKSRKRKKSRSRRKRRSRRKSRSRKRRSRRKSRKRRRSRKRRSRRKRRTRKQRGGRYSQYQSNVPLRPSYTTPDFNISQPWIAGTGSFKKVGSGCRNTYNHYTK